MTKGVRKGLEYIRWCCLLSTWPEVLLQSGEWQLLDIFVCCQC